MLARTARVGRPSMIGASPRYHEFREPAFPTHSSQVRAVRAQWWRRVQPSGSPGLVVPVSPSKSHAMALSSDADLAEGSGANRYPTLRTVLIRDSYSAPSFA